MLRSYTKRLLRNRLPLTKPRRSMAVKAGLAPGTVVYVGKEREGRARLHAWDFGVEHLEEIPDLSPDQIPLLMARPSTTWVNVDGVHEEAVLQAVGEACGIHGLTLEDIANTLQRPKLEEFDDYLYAVIKMVYWEEQSDEIRVEQVSMVLTERTVVTFQEQSEDVFAPLRERLQVPDSRLRRLQSDYFFFALIDVVVSNYFIVLDRLETRIEALEYQINARPHPDALEELQMLRTELLELRRAINPMREVVQQLTRLEHRLLKSKTRVYFQDLRDQIYHATETLDTYRDQVSSLQDLHLSLTSYRMNEVMQVLTIVSTIFIPLTFIAGIYGMNFKYMPELDWPWGYYAVWGLMLLLAGAMAIYFWQKGWFGGRGR